MHGEIGLGGPLFWVLTAFMYGVGAFALFVALDPHRPRRAAALGGAVGKWLWSAPQAVYLLLFAWANVFGFDSTTGVTVFVLATPAAFAAQMAYLLRVVYPSPARLAQIAGPDAVAGEDAEG